jgi:hypothetical protein
MHNIEEEKDEFIESEEEDESIGKDLQLNLIDPSHSNNKGKFENS